MPESFFLYEYHQAFRVLQSVTMVWTDAAFLISFPMSAITYYLHLLW